MAVQGACVGVETTGTGAKRRFANKGKVCLRRFQVISFLLVLKIEQCCNIKDCNFHHTLAIINSLIFSSSLKSMGIADFWYVPSHTAVHQLLPLFLTKSTSSLVKEDMEMLLIL